LKSKGRPQLGPLGHTSRFLPTGTEFWTADKAFFDAVHAELKFVRYLPDYLRRARPKKRKPA